MVLRTSQAIPWRTMSRRIDIELTSSLGDGSWTWRAAGARKPKGVLDGSVLSPDAKVGDELKVEVEQEIDGITILSIVHGRDKAENPNVVELIPSERPFERVVEQRAKRDRGPRRDADRGPRRDGGKRPGRGDSKRDDDRGRRPRGDGPDSREGGGRGRPQGRKGPSFTPPPEVPLRPKPKRLRPGKTNRTAVLADLPEEQRPIADLALQGMGAVRQRVREENQKAVADGRAEMPEASVVKLAEDLLPRLRVAEWRDRAEAAIRQLENLDLRDLRSVVAASGDPMVARDESTRALSDDLKAALVTKQDQELQLWFGDVDAALAVGRVIRALRLSSQPPKAGVPFPVDIAKRLADSANASLAPSDAPDRWSAMLEAAAFSPVRLQIKPTRKPDVVSDELLATVKRLAPALPQIAEMFEVEVDPKVSMPKPLRTNPRDRRGPDGKPTGRPGAGGRGPKDNKSPKDKTGDEARSKKPEGEAPKSPPSDASGEDAAPTAASEDVPIPVDAPEQVNESPEINIEHEATNETADAPEGEDNTPVDEPAPGIGGGDADPDSAAEDATPPSDAPEQSDDLTDIQVDGDAIDEASTEPTSAELPPADQTA
jgi:hypothetical protein